MAAVSGNSSSSRSNLAVAKHARPHDGVRRTVKKADFSHDGTWPVLLVSVGSNEIGRSMQLAFLVEHIRFGLGRVAPVLFRFRSASGLKQNSNSQDIVSSTGITMQSTVILLCYSTADASSNLVANCWMSRSVTRSNKITIFKMKGHRNCHPILLVNVANGGYSSRSRMAGRVPTRVASESPIHSPEPSPGVICTSTSLFRQFDLVYSCTSPKDHFHAVTVCAALCSPTPSEWRIY